MTLCAHDLRETDTLAAQTQTDFQKTVALRPQGVESNSSCATGWNTLRLATLVVKCAETCSARKSHATCHLAGWKRRYEAAAVSAPQRDGPTGNASFP